MRFAYEPYSVSMILGEGDSCVLQIENRRAYASILSDLYMLINYGEGDSVLYEEDTTVDLKKYSDLIFEPFSLDLNNKKIKTRLYQSIVENAKDNYYTQYLDVCSTIQDYVEKITEDIPYNTAFECQFGIEELLKICNVSMDYPCDSIAEKLNVYIKLMTSACKIKIFFIVDIERFVSEEELMEIIKSARYDKINLVLISSEKIEIIPEDTCTYILDDSLCFWKAENI